MNQIGRDWRSSSTEATAKNIQIQGGGRSLSYVAEGAMLDSSPESWWLMGDSSAVRGDAVVILLMTALDQGGVGRGGYCDGGGGEGGGEKGSWCKY